MDSLSEKRNEALQNILQMEFYPTIIEDSFNLQSYTKLPLTRVAALGTSFESIVGAFQSVINGGGTTGIYKVTVPPHGHLASFKDGSGFLGSVLKSNNQVGGGQAVLNPLICNPTALFMAAALASIDKKLDNIQEMQQEILDFLIQKDRCELKGDLIFLTDVMNNYKYNWNNEKYKNNNHNKVLDIKQTSEAKIIFFRKRIIDKSSMRSFLHSDQEVKGQLEKIQSVLEDYQLVLYVFGFASFLEIMLLENYESVFLENVVGKIEDYYSKYRDLYAKCYELSENYSKSSIQSHLLSGLSKASKAAGKAIEKVPVINKSQIDETLVENGRKIGELNNKRSKKTLQKLMDRQDVFILPFIENIKTINLIYNKPLEIFFDRENLYLGAAD